MLIVNPNLCIDRTIHLDELVPGSVHRVSDAIATLGGKGINVARVARAFGSRGTIVGFLPSKDATRLAGLARAEGAELTGIPVEGGARSATILLEPSGRVTVLNEPGVLVDDTDWDVLLGEVRAGAAAHHSITCSGSLPPGSPIDAYGRVVSAAKAVGLRTVVDATGDVLLAAIAAGPDVVSPNLSEAEAILLGVSREIVEHSGPDVEDRAARAVVGLLERGARGAIVSAGSRGAAFNLDGRIAWCAAPVVDVVNPIGAGDSLVGGLLHALEIGLAWHDAVPYAVATASASCENPLAGGVDPMRVDKLVASLSPISFVGNYSVGSATT